MVMGGGTGQGETRENRQKRTEDRMERKKRTEVRKRRQDRAGQGNVKGSKIEARQERGQGKKRQDVGKAGRGEAGRGHGGAARGGGPGRCVTHTSRRLKCNSFSCASSRKINDQREIELRLSIVGPRCREGGRGETGSGR